MKIIISLVYKMVVRHLKSIWYYYKSATVNNIEEIGFYQTKMLQGDLKDISTKVIIREYFKTGKII